MNRAAEPVVGWRVWRVRDAELRSWAVDYAWKPGVNRATCLANLVPAPSRPCSAPPGADCMCGFWALWRPERCFGKARREVPWAHPGFHTAIGLMSGWGVVAIHGDEGFRAEYAAARCVFTTSPWDASLDTFIYRRRPWSLGVARRLRLATDAGGREETLRAVADHYSMPLVTLHDAIRMGLLGELGVPADIIGDMETRLASGRSPLSI
jgi:hypothetical protein